MVSIPVLFFPESIIATAEVPTNKPAELPNYCLLGTYA